MSDIQRYAPERMLVLYDDHAKIVANLRAINEAGDEVINTQAADIRRLESQITRLESRLAAAEKVIEAVRGHVYYQDDVSKRTSDQDLYEACNVYDAAKAKESA